MAKPVKKKPEVTCNIKKIYGFLSEKENKVLAKVAWNDGDSHLELRQCWMDNTGELRLGKGIAISDSEIEPLIDLLQKRLEKIKSEEGVDFTEIFKQSVGVMAAREAGFKTVNGFPVLRKRGSQT